EPIRAMHSPVSADSFLRGGGAGFGDVFVFLRCVSAHTDGANDFSIDEDGNSSLERRSAWQHQRSGSPVFDLVLELLARPAEIRGRTSLADCDIDARDLRIVETLEEQEVPAVVHNGNDDRGTTFVGLGLRRSRNGLGGFEGEHLLYRQVPRNG